MMRVGQAREIAKEWVRQYASREPWFLGSYFSGSSVGMADTDELPIGTDIDIMLVTSEDEPPLKPGKLQYRDTLIEATYLPIHLLSSSEKVLSSYHLAGSFRKDTLIDDPTGHLKDLQREVSLHFAEEKWVHLRCQEARNRVENGLKAIHPSAPFHEQVTNWLFPAGVTTHVLLVAALKNPTIRLRYLKVRNVLLKYGQEELYLELLTQLGCRDFTPEQVEHHVRKLEKTFDAAASIAKTPFFFSTDITPEAKSIAIDGSYELIKSGFHREAVFWIVATFARCHAILSADAHPDLQQAHAPAFRDLMDDLGIRSSWDIAQRSEEVLQCLPRVWTVAESIMAQTAIRP